MGSLEAFVHNQNLIFLKKQLADPRKSAEQRQQLLRLLAKEQANHFPHQNAMQTTGLWPKHREQA
jgi:hypothetical protein